MHTNSVEFHAGMSRLRKSLCTKADQNIQQIMIIGQKSEATGVVNVNEPINAALYLF